MLFANVCEGFISSCYGECFSWRFFFVVLLGVLCIWGVLAWLASLLCTRLGLLWCASCWTRPLGKGRWGHYLWNLGGECLAVHKTACMYLGIHELFMKRELYMLGSVGQDACMVFWTNGPPRRNCRQKQRETSFSPLWFFCSVGIRGKVFWVKDFFDFFGLGGPTNVGGWLTHVDLALEVDVDFLAVVEHRLIPARLGVSGLGICMCSCLPGIFSCCWCWCR